MCLAFESRVAGVFFAPTGITFLNLYRGLSRTFSTIVPGRFRHWSEHELFTYPDIAYTSTLM